MTEPVASLIALSESSTLPAFRESESVKERLTRPTNPPVTCPVPPYTVPEFNECEITHIAVPVALVKPPV